ncbi:uncharacterized protein KD926_007621 [Aspergillus affinis]|uniref:uncharacterized protein n=1 Tax=Aspergillus affinis TaxID=1070780 RepID=UPI0022FDBC44|nr:uncharacterized protein KD926_007621 [Aspergillus affinis]KAI9040813.1 hypothetical protein KD926_007621 [Aspergillus affinis]
MTIVIKKQYYTSERRSTDDTPELQSPESSESEPDEPECDESDGLYGDACCEFDIAWNLPAALDGEDDKKIFLSETQTLTRTKDRVKVMMCQDYILEEHGDMGLVLLENIFSALQSPNNSYEDNSMEIRASYEMIYVLLPRHLCYLMDMLLWLCLSFVKADPGSVYISTAAISEESLTLMPLQPIEETDQHASKEYWHAMFDGVVIAQDPRLETQPCLWLELDFKLLEQLSRVTDTGVYDGGLLLTGPSSTLTPLQELDNYIVWKFDIVNVFEHGGLGLQTPWMRTRSLHQLRSKKALVSWYPQLRGMLLQTEHD